MPFAQLPEAPLARPHDPKAQDEIGDGVRKDTGSQAFRAIGDEIIERAGKQRRDEIGNGMSERKHHCHDAKRQPRKCSERYFEKAFVDQITKQKPSPKNLFDQWNHYDKTEEAHGDGGPIGRSAKDARVKACEARRKTEKLLRRDP